MKMWIRLNKLIKPNGAIVLFGSEPFSSALRMSNIKNYKYDWIWKKRSLAVILMLKTTNEVNGKYRSILQQTVPIQPTRSHSWSI